MQFPESWLRAFCNPPLSTQQIADVLTMGGLEVEELRPAAPPFTKVVVGEIKEAVQAILGAARTGKIGDGKIFLSRIDEAIRIRNDERGEGAL